MGRGSVVRAVVAGHLAACGRAVAARGGVVVFAGLVGMGVARATAAQPAIEPTGRDFAGMRLSAPVVAGRIRLEGSRVSVWSEPTEPGTRRMALDGAVRVTLGDATFEARRAFVWMQNLEPVGAAGGEYQVFVVFEDVGSVASAAGAEVSARWLAVQGIVRTESRPELAADLVRQGRPAGDEGLEDAEVELANHLRRRLGIAALAGGRVIEDDPRVWRPVAVPWAGMPVYARGEDVPTGLEGGVPAAGGDEGAPGTPLVTLPGGAPVVRGPGAPSGGSPGGAGVARLPSGDEGPATAAPARTVTREALAAATARFRGAIAALPARQVEAAQPPARGVVTLDTGDLVVQGGADETMLIASGGVVIQNTDLETGEVLLLKAERAVIFHDPGTIADLARLDREKFRGVYLEGGVMATDGQYTLRGQSVYYDLKSDRAIILDAVFNTFEERLGLPLYMRADVIRQEASGAFTAEKPRLATSAFHEPLLTLGASRITLTQVPGADGLTRNLVEADNLTLNAGPLPFFYWPVFAGEPERFPLRGVTVQSPGGTDGAIRTTWDLLALTGVDGPRDLGAQLEANLLVDWFFQRGVAGGVQSAWRTDRGRGNLLAYGIWDDEGEDRTHSGTRLGHDGENRGLFLAEQRYRMDDKWTILGEFSYIGDETFVDGFFDSDGETRREFATGLAAQRLESNTAVTIQARGNLNDFSANEHILAGPGYTTEKLPEFRYVRLVDDLYPSRPGLLSYSLDMRGGYVRMSFTEPTAAELGFTNPGRAQAGLGVDPDESIADRLRAEGLIEAGVWRGDMRHELSSKFAVGPVNLTPFVVGRATVYDNDFDEFSPRENDELRLWGSAGVTASTSVQRVYNGVESSLLDLHRLRHIIEPSATILHAASTVDSADLPIYDDDVEGLAEGTTARIGVRQTLQTQRGAAGLWRSVDFLVLDLELIWNDDERGIESLIPRFYEPRPELSSPGTFGRIDALWHATESLGLTGEMIYSFDQSQPARTSLGYLIRHTPQLLSSGELRYLNPHDVTYADFAWQYELTDKYAFIGSMSLDVDEGDFRRARLGLRREFPGFYLRADFVYDNIQEEASIGLTFQPIGAPLFADRDLE